MSLDPYPEYKDSQVEWIGALPAGWQVRRLWTLFSREKNVGFPEEQMLSVFRDYGVVPKASRENLNKTAENRNIYQLVEPGWLVSNRMKAWQGSVGISTYRGIVSGHYICFRPTHQEDNRFLNWLFRSEPYTVGYKQISRGVRIGQAEIDNDAYRLLPVIVPPIEEQQAVADYLDYETAKIDAFIADQEELIDLLNERRASTITRAVTKGIDPAAAMKDSGIEWLGQIPLHWSVRGIKAAVATIGGSGFPHEYQGVGSEELPFHKVSALAGAGSDGVIRDSMDTVSRTTAKILGARIFPAGTIVMAKIGAALLLGRMRSVDRPFCIDNNMLALVPNVGYVTKYLIYALQIVRFNLIVNPGAVPSLDMVAFRNYPIAFPSEQEQKSVAAFLDHEMAEIDAIVAEAREAIALSKERRTAVISAAVTGKIDVRGASVPATNEMRAVSVGVA